MKTLLSTTALVVAFGFPALTIAQTTAPSANPATQQQNVQMNGFVASRGQSDLHASDLMGRDVYARRDGGGARMQDSGQTTQGQAAGGQATQGQATQGQAAGGQAAGGQASMTAGGTHQMSTMNRADLDNMDNIGQINDIILSSDGRVRAIVIGIGGFLGIGEQDVAVTMDQVTFASDADDRSEMYVVVNTGAEMLKNSPPYDRTYMTTDQTQGASDARTDRTAFTAPSMTRDGYDRVEMTEITSDLLVGQTVYGVNDDSVGTIDDLILDDAGKISNVIIDFGGFLGIGSRQVAVGFDELTIMADEGRANVRVYVDATKEQVQGQPRYTARN